MYGEINKGFERLLGKEHKFYGVDSNCFKLNSQVFEAVEDEDDGYRSYLGSVLLLGKPKDHNLIFPRHSFARVTLIECSYGDFEGYQIQDLDYHHIWLRFGTDNVDDYYPFFVFEYQARKS